MYKCNDGMTCEVLVRKSRYFVLRLSLGQVLMNVPRFYQVDSTESSKVEFRLE